MSRNKRSLIGLASVLSLALLCFALLTLFGSCSSDSTPVEEDAAADVKQEEDTNTNNTPEPDFDLPPDVAPDKYVWPDTAPPKDTWPDQTDTYAATPFGCNTDADCFGRKCCATPWGVKLCATECN